MAKIFILKIPERRSHQDMDISVCGLLKEIGAVLVGNENGGPSSYQSEQYEIPSTGGIIYNHSTRGNDMDLTIRLNRKSRRNYCAGTLTFLGFNEENPRTSEILSRTKETLREYL